MGFETFEEVYAVWNQYHFEPADSTSYHALYPGLLVTTRIDQLIACSDDVIDHDIIVVLDDGSGTPLILGTVAIPAGAGLTTVPSVDLLAAIQTGGLGYLLLNNNLSLSAKMVVVVGAGKTVSVVVFGGQF